MTGFSALILPLCQEKYFFTELLSCSVLRHISSSVFAVGVSEVFYAGSLDESEGFIPALEQKSPIEAVNAFYSKAENQCSLLFFMPAPAVGAGSLADLLVKGESSPAVLTCGKTVLALAGPAQQVKSLIGGDLSGLKNILSLGLPSVSVPTGDGSCVTDAEGAYLAQETLRRRINLMHMRNNVMLVDPNTTHISPLAQIEPGAIILPNCQVYGRSVIKSGCRIGPNTYLQDAVLGENVKVNASQIFESSVGDGTTVGPFSYIRPGCNIGSRVKIGDFVELKKSAIGNGTKISHLTYIGDSEFGQNINVGCGVVTVNYDGKKKHKTVAEDGSFIGCNVNLIPPVKVGRGAYIAAGSTLTEDAPEDSLVIGRVRQEVKPGWAKKRRDSGLL